MIVKSNEGDKFLVLFFDNNSKFTNIEKVIFKNYNIIKQDRSLENSWWIYDEIYKVNDKYELHVLLQNKNKDFIEFTSLTEYIEFYKDKNKMYT
ncbi:DUF4085 family protein [Clostridium felsineum]|nr:DUF4085 family protein [Clostridium felsineum]URZ01684.1 hypothetical protein CLAUR_016790 [Clostridium felsineum]